MKSSQHPPHRRHREHAVAETVSAEAESPSVSIEDRDELLDDIDALLEDQAVLTNFRQRSGQ